MAQLTPFGQPANQAESDVILYLQNNLSEAYEICHNLEIRQGKEVFEIDLVIFAPQCVFVVDVKGTHGRIDIYGSKWHPQDRPPYHSPIARLRQHAKILSSLISDFNRAKPDLRKVHVHPVAILTAEDVFVVDYSGLDEPFITYADKRCLTYFKSKDFIPSHRLTDIRSFNAITREAILGKSAPINSLPCYGDWQVIEKLGGNAECIEYRAHKTFLEDDIVRLKVYQVNPYLDAEQRLETQKLISNAYQALRKVPYHRNILSVTACFPTQDEDFYVLVTEDIQGQSLRQHCQNQTLSLEQKWTIIQETLAALDHAHQAGVIHRNVTPDNIFVGFDGRTYLIGFDYARMMSRNTTIADDIIAALEEDAAYQAQECYRNPSGATPRSDLFSAGLVFYELLSGQPAFQSAAELTERKALFPEKPSHLNPKLPSGIDQWLQKLCAFEPDARYQSADDALKNLAPLVTEQSLDVSDLSVGTTLDDRYEILERLGEPGSFGVAYKVSDGWEKDVRVLKLVTRDRQSVYDRLLQEYWVLKQIPPHPYIVKPLGVGELKIGIPFISFEYVEGRSVVEAIATQQLSRQIVIQLIQQAAEGLRHIHQHGVYHQDIKPSNLFLTDQGVKIIDFNVSVSDTEPSFISVGTPRYMAPDLRNKHPLTTDEKIDRDLYGLGLTFYECLTGHYPFETDEPPLNQLALDPRHVEACDDLDEVWVEVLQRAIAPKHQDRFTSADEFLSALQAVQESIQSIPVEPPSEEPSLEQESNSDTERKATEQPSNLSPTPPDSTGESTITEVSESSPQGEVFTKTESNHNVEESSSQSEIELTSEPFSVVLPSHPQSIPNADQPIVLDPTRLYQIPSSYIAITSEVEWLQKFGRSGSPYWVRGKRLCQWAKDWLRAWDKIHLIAEEKQPPRDRLKQWFEETPIPSNWTDEKVLSLVAALESYASDNPIVCLLSNLTNTDRQFWVTEPSLEHLAQWLTIQVPSDFLSIEQVWSQSLPVGNLSSFYQPSNKVELLRRWIGLKEPEIPELGKYPGAIPQDLLNEFEQAWQERLYRSEGTDLDKLNFSEMSGGDRVAELTYQIFTQRPDWITRDRIEKVSAYLNHQQKLTLASYEAPPTPEPLAVDETPENVLTWVTDQYLPFRQWEIVFKKPPINQRESDQFADSFVNWILENYPKLKEGYVGTSLLNYRVGHTVNDRVEDNPILWVVVDGLGWLDQQELLSYLTKDGKLRLDADPQPLFSVLPTKTEFAKWSLYSQRLPDKASPTSDAGKGFNFENGKRYTDSQIDKLYKDLRRSKYQIYCWDTTLFDELFHHQTDWHSLYHRERILALEIIAKRIHNCIEEYPNPDSLQIIIASDHGQIMGITSQITTPPPELQLKGRMAVGKTDDPRFAVLEHDRFALPYDISVVRGSGSLNAYSYTTDQGIIGSHGGLFPEEAVIGFSSLRCKVKRSVVLVNLSGEVNNGQSGYISLTVHNTNNVSLTNLKLLVPDIASFQSGLVLAPIIQSIPANIKTSVQVPLDTVIEIPADYRDNTFSTPLRGSLSFQYAGTNETGTASLDEQSVLTIKRMFSSGLENGLDDFM